MEAVNEMSLHRVEGGLCAGSATEKRVIIGVEGNACGDF
ncbi:hypothetical protein NOC27_2313 [Nitrosococcus oceani AFC27]|nr:hypothetical protein NOC27_2313 [Nitrosococcus oceani AFC27]